MRLFVALNFLPPVREALWAATARLRDLDLPVKWVRGEAVHLTLKFLGDVADERVPELAAALTSAAAGARPLSLALGGFGVFPDFRRPRVVWVGIEPEPGLGSESHAFRAAAASSAARGARRVGLAPRSVFSSSRRGGTQVP